MIKTKSQKLFQVKAGDIVWVNYGEFDTESKTHDNRQKGVRPAVILSNTACCESSPVVVSCLTGTNLRYQ